MEPNKILKSDVLDLLFENRNKDYGAYNLRRTYNKRIRNALLITFGTVALLLLASFMANNMNEDDAADIVVRDVVLEDIKQQEEEKPEPPPPPPPPKVEPPKVEMTKFTPPVIKKDEEVKQDEIPPEVEELKDTKIDVVSQEGIKDLGIAVPPVVDEGKAVVEAPKKEDENQVFTKVEIEASYAGDWGRFLQRTLNAETPVNNGAPAGQYTVVVQFIVDKGGNISDVKALTNHGYGMEEEAVRSIKKASKWNPAVQNGRQVNAYRKQPITFVVSEE
jgi:periplasmic protein TonB